MPETVVTSRTASRRKRAKPDKRRRLRRVLTLFFLFALLIVGGAAAALVWKLNDGLNTISQSGQTGQPGISTDTLYHPDKPMSIVLLGRDTRKETGSLNTDVMIVAVVNPQTKKVTMLSIPRDTRVKIPGYRGYHKINSVYADGEMERRQAEANGETPTETGISLTKKTLESMLGIPIQHYVEVDFQGFKAIVDELGGIEVNVDRKLVYDDPTDDTHIHLEPGLQVLNGEQALGYVRHRHDNRGLKYFSTDFDRNRRQQQVIRAIVDKMKTMGGITKIFSLIDVASQHVKTDLSPEQIKGLAYDFKDITSSNIVTLENGAFWSPSLGFTLIPKENRDIIRSTLQSEMGVSPDEVADLNDSWVAGYGADDQPVTAPRTEAPKKKKRTEETVQSVPVPKTETSVAPKKKTAAQPTPPAPKTEQAQTKPPADLAEPQPQDGASNAGGETPPPDIPAGPDGQQPQAKSSAKRIHAG